MCAMPKGFTDDVALAVHIFATYLSLRILLNVIAYKISRPPI